MSNHRFPSFNFPYAPSEDLRQFFVDYGRTGPAYIFKDDGGTIDCIQQKKEITENRKVRLIANKPTLPLNLPGKISGELNTDFKSEFEHSRKDVQELWDCEQPLSNLVSDNCEIIFGGLAKMVGIEADKLSWKPPQSLPFFNNMNAKTTMLDPILKRFQTDFCDIPLDLLTDLVQESCKQDKVTASGKYYGNCLEYTKTQESSIVLVYPGGPTMSELCFSNLEIDAQGERESSARVEERGTFLLPERICQVSMCDEIDESSVVAVRTDNKCWFFGTGYCGDLRKPTVIGNLGCKTKPCSVTGNPYIPEEVLVTMETGSLWLWSAEDSSVEVVRQCSASTPEEFDWYFSEFGSHPRQVIRANHTNVELIDLRGGSSTTQDFMTLPSPHFFPDDKFTAIQHYHDNPYHYFLATTQSLVIMDERFQQNPVLKWSHSLEYPPKYLNVLPDPTSQDVLVFAGCYKSQDVHCFQYCYGETSGHYFGMVDASTSSVLPPRSTSAPWKISSYNDWAEMADYPRKAESYLRVNERLLQPLLGLALIPQSTPTLLTAVQLSSTGDLFYQNIFPRENKLSGVREEGRVLFYEDFDLDLTSSGGCGSKKPDLSEKDEEFITNWVECLRENAYEESKDVLEELSESCPAEDVGLIREKLFSSLEIESQCSLCSCNDLGETSSVNEEAAVVCHYCGLSSEQSEQFHNVMSSERTVLTKEYLGLNFKPEKLELFDEDKLQCSETLGSTLLKNWNSTEQEAIGLTERHESETDSDKQNAVKNWLETGSVTPVRKISETEKSPAKKKKCLIISPSEDTVVRKQNVASESVGENPKSANSKSVPTKKLSSNFNISLMKSPKTPKITRTAELMQRFESSYRQSLTTSPKPANHRRVSQSPTKQTLNSPVPPSRGQDSQTISSQQLKASQASPWQQLKANNLHSPENVVSTSVNKATPTRTLKLAVKLMSPGVRDATGSLLSAPVGQTRSPAKKKITRVPGF